MPKAIPPANNENKIRRIDFLKVIGSNPDRKVMDISKEFSMSQSAAYNAINEFIFNYIQTDEDKEFPSRLLAYYNKDVTNPDEQLNVTDVQQLKHFVDDYYSKHLPGGDLSGKTQEVSDVYIPAEIPQDNYNNPTVEQSYSRMSQPPPQGPQFNQGQFQKNDLSQDAGFLRTLLTNAKYVHPSIIDRFISQYDLNKEVFDRDPLSLLDIMKHMFTNQQGEQIWKLFQKGRGKFVYGADGSLHPGPQAQMDPNLMMMMMNFMNQGGGGMNPAMMMPMMQQMGGGGQPGMGGMDPNSMMMMMMMQQMGQKSQKDQQKQDTNEMFEKLIQAIMLKMVGGATDEKKPWDIYGMMGGGMMPGMMGPPTVQEVMDPNGRVTQRNIVPSFGMGQQQHQDPILTTVLNNTMNTNTQLLMKLTEVGKTPTDILLGMIPYFKDSGNATLQLSNMIKTMNEIAPGFFTKGGAQQDAQNIEIARLKFDTDLAMQAQRLELSKMEHTWRIDEMDRKANNENASNWMHMIENLGGSFTEKIAPALMEGLGKGGLLPGGKPGQGGPGQSMDPQQQMMRMQQMKMQQMQAQQRDEREEKLMQEQMKMQQQQAQQQQQTQQTEQQQAMFMVAQLQAALQQSEQQKQHLMMRIRDIESVPTQAYRGGPQQQISDQQLLRMPSGELQSMLQELKAQSSNESSIQNRIETILANRYLMDQHQPPQQQPEQPTQNESFNTGKEEAEEVSSDQTRDMEEHYDGEPPA